jgi:hypothetical protein
MAKDAEKPFVHIEVIAAALEQEPVLANLLELRACDFSDFHDLGLGEDGSFGYESLSPLLEWAKPTCVSCQERWQIGRIRLSEARVGSLWQ